ncbi:MAG: pentapeptide repeat-containing protein, partial [Proteobacteria bacterium]|nr:pentapeptide repeat-containing protein [Pseudomonadota bacterium]
MTETTTQKKSIPAGSFADKKWRFCRAFYKKLGIDLKKLLEIPSNKHPEKNKMASDHWNTFLKKIIEPKKSAAHNGWRWLCAISYLVDIRHPRYIREDLPDEHPLKLDNATFINFETLAENLKSDLGNLTKISKIDFSGVEFENDINFSNFIFPVKTDFSNTTFLKDALFTDAVFLENAEFKNAKFNGERAKFKKAVFKKIANFEKATFKHYANFANSKFSGRTTFQH